MATTDYQVIPVASGRSYQVVFTVNFAGSEFSKDAVKIFALVNRADLDGGTDLHIVRAAKDKIIRQMHESLSILETSVTWP